MGFLSRTREEELMDLRITVSLEEVMKGEILPRSAFIRGWTSRGVRSAIATLVSIFDAGRTAIRGLQ